VFWFIALGMVSSSSRQIPLRHIRFSIGYQLLESLVLLSMKQMELL
jgi:hypothetical protein